MLPNWLSEIFTIVTDPFYGKLILSIVIIVLGLIAVNLVNLMLSRWEKRLKAIAAEKPSIALAPSRTKFQMMRRIANFLIYFLIIMFILLQIPPIKAIGTTLLAGAGVIGLVAGLAAQATLSNVIAGIALAFSQPVRLGDAVI